MALNEASAADCDFCRIAAGSEPAEIVCSAVDWIAFFPIAPATPGHTLIIPRIHVSDIWELELPLAKELMDATLRVGRAVQSAMEPQGMNVISSSGSVAAQSVFHVHIHVVPRWEGDSVGPIWPAKSEMKREPQADAAARIRAECQKG